MNDVKFKLNKTELDVRFRHCVRRSLWRRLDGPKLHEAVVVTEGSDRVKIMLKTESQQGIAAGQFAVLYDGDVCLGGGIIEQALIKFRF